MAVFVDLDDDDVDVPQQSLNAMKPIWNNTAPSPSEPSARDTAMEGRDWRAYDDRPFSEDLHRNEAAHEPAVQEPANSVTVALGCYP